QTCALPILQQADNPAVCKAQFGSSVGVQFMAFGVHQHKAGGVPQLVAEVAIAFTALHVEVDVATQGGVSGHGKAQRVRTEGGDAIGIVLLGALANALSLLGIHQAKRALVYQAFQVDAVDQIHRVNRVALGFAHLLAFHIAHQSVNIDGVERNAAGQVHAHHDHAGHPEENNVEASYQHAGGQV